MITIPLQAGAVNSHQRFSVQLGKNLVDFRMDWNYLTNRWLVNLEIEGVTVLSGGVLAAGGIINRSMPEIGILFFNGNDATVDNLGIENSLVWVDG